jgi:hypothetical protein
VDQHAEVVEQRPFRLGDVALDQLEVGAADLDAPVAGGREAVAQPLPGGSPSTTVTTSPSGSSWVRGSAPETRSPMRSSTPRSRGPSSSNNVSLPRFASAPTSVNLSVRSITCMPSCAVQKSAITSRSDTQSAT